MKLKLFIDRPILACVVSVLILLVGLIGLVNLPMEQYPDIATPTVSVSATYTGANVPRPYRNLSSSPLRRLSMAWRTCST